MKRPGPRARVACNPAPATQTILNYRVYPQPPSRGAFNSFQGAFHSTNAMPYRGESNKKMSRSTCGGVPGHPRQAARTYPDTPQPPDGPGPPDAPDTQTHAKLSNQPAWTPLVQESSHQGQGARSSQGLRGARASPQNPKPPQRPEVWGSTLNFS